MRSDNGANFVGTINTFEKALNEMDQFKIAEILQSISCQWMKWKMNPPKASHMFGVWKRQIRSIRAILSSFLLTHGLSLNDESLTTLLTESECVVNSRPLTVKTLSDPCSPCQLTGNYYINF